jgi:hypothetical protein
MRAEVFCDFAEPTDVVMRLLRRRSVARPSAYQCTCGFRSSAMLRSLVLLGYDASKAALRTVSAVVLKASFETVTASLLNMELFMLG